MPLTSLGMHVTLNVESKHPNYSGESAPQVMVVLPMSRVSVCDGVCCTAQIGYSWDSLLEQRCGVRNHLY